MRSHVAIGVMILTVCGFIPAPVSTECNPTEDIPLVQTMCQVMNDDLLKAELDGDHIKVCMNIILFMKCVVTNATRCFDYFNKLNEYYFHSPHNCELTREQMMELQEIHNNKTQVTIVSLPPSSSTTKYTPTSTPLTTNEGDSLEETEGGATEGGGGEGGGTTGKRDGANEGSREEQKGTNSRNGATTTTTTTTTLLSSMSMVMLVLMSHSLSWRLAS